MAPIRKIAETLRMVQRQSISTDLPNDELKLELERCACHLERHALVDSDSPGHQPELASQVEKLRSMFLSKRIDMARVISTCAIREFERTLLKFAR